MMWGADAGELLQLSQRLDARADEIDRAQRELTGRLRSAPWNGPGADRYRQRWEAQDRRQILSAVAFLRQSATDLRANAAQQESASTAFTPGALLPTNLFGAFAPAARGLSPAEARDLFQELFQEIFPNLAEILDNSDLIQGVLGKVLGGTLGAFSAFMAALDLVYVHPYEGNFDKAESAADILKIAGGTIAIAGAVTGNPVVIGVGVVVGGTGMLVDYALEGWELFGRDAVHLVATQSTVVARQLDRAWDSAYEVAEAGIAESARAAEHAADQVVSGVVQGAGALKESAQGTVEAVASGAGAVWRKVQGWRR